MIKIRPVGKRNEQNSLNFPLSSDRLKRATICRASILRLFCRRWSYWLPEEGKFWSQNFLATFERLDDKTNSESGFYLIIDP
jgi:hypothetical protein